MSRYNIQNESGQKYVYGFDNPLSEYFLDKGNQHLCGPLSKTYGDAPELYGLLKKEKLWGKIPENHREAILGDEIF